MESKNSLSHTLSPNFIWNAKEILETFLKKNDWHESYLSSRWYDSKYINESDSNLKDTLLSIVIVSLWKEDEINEETLNLLNLVIENSLQNWTIDWIDLNKPFKVKFWNREEKFLFTEVIEKWHYDIFEKLISLNVGFLQFTDLSSILAKTEKYMSFNYSGNDINEKNQEYSENKLKILEKLLKLGLDFTEGDIIKFIEYWNLDLLELVYENDLQKERKERIFNLKFIKKILNWNDSNFSMLKYKLENDNGEKLNFLNKLFYKIWVEETLINDRNKDSLDKSLNIIREETKKDIEKISTSPEFIAEIVSKVLAEKWDYLTAKVIDGLKENLQKRVLERSEEIVNILLSKR